MIHQVQGLGCDGRGVARCDGGVDVGKIEDFEEFESCVPERRRVKAAADIGKNVAVLAGGGLATWLAFPGVNVRAADGEIELAAGGEDRVADFLGFESSPMGP